LDCGSGTLGILLPQAILFPTAVYIGFEKEQQIHAHGVNINRVVALDSQDASGAHGPIATRCRRAQSAGSFMGVTNCPLFDGSCSRADCLDQDHILLIAIIMSTASVDEFSTTKLASSAALDAYMKANIIIRNSLHQWTIFSLDNCPQHANRFKKWMFVRRLMYRLPRSATILNEVPSIMNEIIADLQSRSNGSTSNTDLCPYEYEEDRCRFFRGVDNNGDTHKLVIGDVSVHCFLTANKFCFGEKLVHIGLTAGVFVGVCIVREKNQKKKKKAIVRAVLLRVQGTPRLWRMGDWSQYQCLLTYRQILLA